MGYNNGGVTSSSIARQFSDEFVTKAVINEASRKRPFSQMSNKATQPKNFGTKMTTRRDFPIFHPLNRMDGGVDASKATLMEQVFYVYDQAVPSCGNGVDGVTAGLVANGELPDGGYAVEADAITEAASVASGKGVVKSSSGLLYGGTADWNAVNGNFPILGEEGGAVNLVNSRSVLVEGVIKKFGIADKYTVDEVDMGSIQGLIAKKIKDLGEARADIREMQIQYDLMAAGEANVLYSSGSASTVSDAQVGPLDVLTHASLRQMAQDLKKARVPKDTKVITGSTKVGTKVVGKAYYAYVAQEMYPMLEDMKNADGKNVWEPVETYMDAAMNNIADGEIGRIGQFRFIEVEDLLRNAGAGVAADDISTAEDGSTTGAVSVHSTNGKTDVFSTLIVGSDSFTTIGFTGDTTKAKHNVPKGDSHNDFYGEVGSIAIRWWHGTMITRPERIRVIKSAASLV